MKKNEPPDVKKLTALSAGIVIAVGFAYWNISNTLSAEPGSRRTDVPKTGADLAQAAAADPSAATEPGTSGPLPAPNGLEANRPVSPLDGPNEMLLAVDADPFTELPKARTTPTTSSAVRVAAEPRTAPGFLPPTLPAPSGRLFQIPVVRPASPFGSVAPRRVEEPVPELLGTLLGSRPCAVFQADGGTVVVPAGQSYQSWKVIAVDHGTVTVRGRHGTRELRVRGVLSAGTSRPEAAGEATLAEPEAPPAKMGDLMAVAPVDLPKLPARTMPVLYQASPESPLPAGPVPTEGELAPPGSPEPPVGPGDSPPPAQPPR